MKQWFEPDKVMWGVFRVSLGGCPPIFKHVFVHWIGLKVSGMKCGHWNFKTAQVVEKVQEHLTINHKITAHGLRDLDLAGLLKTLKRMTYGVQVLGAAGRKAMAEVRETYAEDFSEPVANLQGASFECPTACGDASPAEVSDELQARGRMPLGDLTNSAVEQPSGAAKMISSALKVTQQSPQKGESASHNPELADALNCVRMPKGKWNWVLLRVDSKPASDSM